jgi:ferric-dicitrate binding protein FerR (iron transport regulator)
VIKGRDPEAGTVESQELERLCDELARFEAPFDEITRSRAEARLGAALERQPGRGNRRALGRVAVLLAVGAAAGVALTARTVVTARRSRVAGSPEPAIRFEPYVVAPTAGAGAATLPEPLEQPASRLDVPAGWLVRASLGDAVAITLTGPARAWSESAAGGGRTVVHLDRGRLLASLEGGTGRRLEIVSPGAITDVVGTLFSVEVVGGASRVAVAHGRVQVGTAPGSSGQPPRAPREIAAGQSWLTALPEPDAIEPSLAEALAEHERTPPPRGAAVPLSVIEAPAGAGVWVGKRRIASAPAWMLVESHVAVRLSAPARAAAPPAEPFPPPSTEPALEPALERSRPGSRPLASATTPTAPRPQLTRSGAERTEPSEPPPFAPPEAVTAQTLFRAADAARAAGNTTLALRTLRTLVERFPRESATAAARYELALMEETAGHGDAALRDLAAVDTPSLEEPTAYLRCRVLAKRAPTEAERCLADFRRQFPASAHDADALAAETALAMLRGGCAAAQALLAELERRHPEHGAAVRLRAACGSRP